MTKVLVIDDCEEIRDIVHDMLADEGYEVSVAVDSNEAIAHLDTQGADLVLCDLVLPLGYEDALEENDSAMVGVHCINELARMYPTVPIIAISGELTGGALSAVECFGACTTLSKPFGRDELISVVQKALGNVN